MSTILTSNIDNTVKYIFVIDTNSYAGSVADPLVGYVAGVCREYGYAKEEEEVFPE